MSLAAYPAFLGTFLSVTGLTYLAWREHTRQTPRTLSELAASNQKLVNYFRVVLWVCGTLFAVTMFFYIVPNVKHTLYQLLAWIVYYGCEVLLGIFPARGTIERLLHNIFAYAMGAAMLATVLLFAISFHGNFAITETVLTVAMTMLGTLTILDRKRVIFYELPFIFLSHASILAAALALR